MHGDEPCSHQVEELVEEVCVRDTVDCGVDGEEGQESLSYVAHSLFVSSAYIAK